MTRISLFLVIICSVWASDDVDQFDHLAAIFSIKAFHLYAQHVNQEPHDLRKETIRHKSFGWMETHHATDSEFLSHWDYRSIFGKTGAQFWARFQRDSLLGVVAYNKIENILLIAFRGSQRGIDWINNCNFSRKLCPGTMHGYRLQAGYVNGFTSVLSSLEEQIQSLIADNPEPRVILTGHSMGGSIATVAAGYFCERYKHVELRTFGTPYVGTKYYRSWLEKHLKIARTFVRKTDLATWNPSGIGCCHVGTYVQLPSYGIPITRFVTAHDPDLYRKGICEILDIPHSPLYTTAKNLKYSIGSLVVKVGCLALLSILSYTFYCL